MRSGRGLLAVLAVFAASAGGSFSNGGATRWYDVAVPMLAAIAAVINWLVTRWKLDGVTLRIETGLLRRDSRQLPIARIQAVDLVRPMLARMLGLTELRVRLAGSSDADGRLAYLPEQAADALRARLLAAQHGLDPATPEPSEHIVATVPTGRLVGSVVVPAALLTVLTLAAGLLVAVLSPARLIAVAGALAWWVVAGVTLVWRRVSTQYGFTVAASGDGIRIRRGLLGTVAETIPVDRVQAVTMIEPLLWRAFGWVRLEVDVAGRLGRDSPEGSPSARKALLAVGNHAQARDLVLMAVGPGRPALTKPPRRSRLKAPLSFHYLAAGHDESLAVTVTGRVRRVTTWVPLAKTQSVRFIQGPVQRWLGLATVHLDAAGRQARAEFAERELSEARRLVDELAGLSRTARRLATHPPVPPQAAPLAGPAGPSQAASGSPAVNASQSDA